MQRLLCKPGETYGQLTVQYQDTTRTDDKIYWFCSCSCGDKDWKSYAQSSLRNGRASRCKKCGYKKATETRLGKEYKDFIGFKHGALTVLKRDDTSHEKVKWICQCECGNQVSLIMGDIKHYKYCSLKCPLRGRAISESKTYDLTGKVFGQLTVLYRDLEKEKTVSWRGSLWRCQCSCGRQETFQRASLIEKRRNCCYFCSKGMSTGEKIIEEILSKNNIRFKKQISFPDLLGPNGGKCKFDFGIYDEEDKLIRLVEFDGEFHYVERAIWNAQNIQKTDVIKNEYVLKHNIPLIRIPYWEKENISLKMLLNNDFLLEDARKKDD